VDTVRFFNRWDDALDITVSTVVKNGKTELEWFENNSEKRKESYALPTPHNIDFRPDTVDSKTSTRGPGRPKKDTYIMSDSKRFVSTGKMTDSAAS
jgi:hypothetical protein